jgi:RNA polymerase sigma-70 factor (ECF subfamily)
MATEIELVEAAMGGSREAFSELAAGQWRRLIRLARSTVASQDGEDVVQEALLQAWKRLPSLRNPRSFGPWLTRIVVNRAIRWASRTRNNVPLRDDHEPTPELQTADHDSARQVERKIDVATALRLLSPRQRAVMHMTYIDGMSDSEIGEALGIGASSVRTHRLRAQQRLTWLNNGGR